MDDVSHIDMTSLVLDVSQLLFLVDLEYLLILTSEFLNFCFIIPTS